MKRLPTWQFLAITIPTFMAVGWYFDWAKSRPIRDASEFAPELVAIALVATILHLKREGREE